MALRAGMSIAEAIQQLTKGFQKVMGRKPDGLEKIKIQQEAVKRLKELEKVVDMQGNVIDTSKGIMGGKQIQESKEFGKKVRETYDAAKGPGKGQEMVDALKSPGAKKSYKIMEDQLGVKLYGDETFDEILEIQRTGKNPRGEPGSGITSESLKKKLMEGKNPFSDLVKTTDKGPKTLEQRRKEAQKALRNKNVVPIEGKILDKQIKQEFDKAMKEGKFKDVRLRDGREIKSEDDFREYIDELNEDSNFATGGRAGFANGSEGIMSLDEGAPSILLRPRASGIMREQQIAPGINLSERDINYGISGILQGDKFYGGASLDKGKVKLDVETEDGQTLFKDTIAKDDALNFILGMGDPKGEKDKFQIKFDDDLENMSLILKKSFAEGGRANFEKGGMSRRQFMKIMGGIATLPVLGKFIKPAMPLIQKGAEITAPALDKIVQTVMSAGKLISQSGRRVKEMVTKKKFKDVEVEEDIMDGPSYTIKTKDKTIYYRPGRQDEMGIEDDIIEVIEDTVTKKAGGGIARMLGE